MLVENGEISYFKAKDPSFVNWTLIEYAVLKNIIADFPICNKSYDLSYSGTDM
jgi:Ni,Fe-hydrogenase III large subunit